VALEGRIALVSGGGRGIGRAIALGLAQDGADLAVNYRRDAEAAAETVSAIEALDRRAVAYPASVDRFEPCEAMVKQIEADLGPVDILVANAGIASRGQNVKNTEPAELERVVAIHALSAYYLAKLVIPGMRQRPRGDVVMISSVATKLWGGHSAPYNMGKAALEALALTLAKEERRYGIHVNTVAPGLVETEMGRRLVKATQGVDDLRKLDEHMPYGHVCTPEEVADVVRFFVSDAARYLNGQTLYVDGGGP